MNSKQRRTEKRKLSRFARLLSIAAEKAMDAGNAFAILGNTLASIDFNVMSNAADKAIGCNNEQD